MCANYFIDENTVSEMVEIIYNLYNEHGFETVTYDQIYPKDSAVSDVYPKQRAPVCGMKEGDIVIVLPEWGFPRHDGASVMFNARDDKLETSFVWKDAYATNRCVVPARGFYETKTNEDGKKERIYFLDPEGNLLLLGAILDEEKEHYSIITTDPNASVASVHNRMPLLIQKEELYRWLTEKEYADFILGRESQALISEVKPRETKKKDTGQMSLFDEEE